MASRENLMPIGRFSASCRLSIKALRYYDEQGLLKPAFIDPDSGYRYYARHQARTAVIIGMLRSLGIPISAIREILAAGDEQLASLLMREQARLSQELARQQQALRSIERLAREADLMPYQVAVRDEPACRVARKTVSTSVDMMLGDSADAIYAVFALLGTDMADPVMCINEAPDKQGRMVVHACVGTSVESAVSIEIVEIPAARVVWLTHRGAYEELGIAYHTLAAWIQEHGHQQTGAMREIYRNDPKDTPTDALVTEVMIPI